MGSTEAPKDAAYNQCAVDRRVVVNTEGKAAIPVRTTFNFQTRWRVVVDPDSSLNMRLTKQLESGSDQEWEMSFLHSMQAWKFQPAMRGGRPVRSALMLKVHAGGGLVDTLPATIQWTYKVGISEDTIVGKWMPGPPLAPLPDSALAQVYLRVVDRLRANRVVIPSYQDEHCLVLPNENANMHARVSSLIQASVGIMSGHYSWRLGPFGCERSIAGRRIILSTPHQIENGRIVMSVSGDYLPHYPLGVGGRSWAAWQGRCEGIRREGVPFSPTCNVEVDQSRSTGWFEWYRQNQVTAQNARKSANSGGMLAPGDSVVMTVIATTSWVPQNDTMRTVLRDIPLLSEHAVTDSLLSCGGWGVYTQQDSSELYVVHGNPFENTLEVTRATHRPTPKLPINRKCAPQAAQPLKHAAFILGGIGSQVSAPIDIVYTDGKATKHLDPARHTLATQPHFKIRMRDLRAETRQGKGIVFRVQLSTVLAGAVPLAVLPPRNNPAWHEARLGTPVAPGVWDFGMAMPETPDAEVYIYLMIRR